MGVSIDGPDDRSLDSVYRELMREESAPGKEASWNLLSHHCPDIFQALTRRQGVKMAKKSHEKSFVKAGDRDALKKVDVPGEGACGPATTIIKMMASGYKDDFLTLKKYYVEARKIQIKEDPENFLKQSDEEIEAEFVREVENYVYEGKELTPFLQTAVLAVRLRVIKVQAERLAKVLIETVLEKFTGEVSAELKAVIDDKNNDIGEGEWRKAARFLKNKADSNSPEWRMYAGLAAAKKDDDISSGYRIYNNFFSKPDCDFAYKPNANDLKAAVNSFAAISGDGISQSVVSKINRSKNVSPENLQKIIYGALKGDFFDQAEKKLSATAHLNQEQLRILLDDMKFSTVTIEQPGAWSKTQGFFGRQWRWISGGSFFKGLKDRASAAANAVLGWVGLGSEKEAPIELTDEEMGIGPLVIKEMLGKGEVVVRRKGSANDDDVDEPKVVITLAEPVQAATEGSDKDYFIIRYTMDFDDKKYPPQTGVLKVHKNNVDNDTEIVDAIFSSEKENKLSQEARATLIGYGYDQYAHYGYKARLIVYHNGYDLFLMPYV
ncbi:MAG: hypothetical protein GY821_08650 [Gammaproteobacteria bacterium]|nr:hypothetical protein [Gammaproteobacteria bacterium]